MSFSPPPNSVPPRADGVAAEEASLRAELDGARTNEQRAQLLVELGALHLRSKDYASAARELLAAINANSTFVEPLDQLICLMERRRSHKNLAKLLERRLRLSRSAIESADVALRLACLHLANQEPEAALRATLEAVEMRPDDPEAWALLRLVASQLDDEDAKCRALKELVRLSVSPARRAWQLLDLAALKLERGDVSGAEADLEEATAGAVDARSRAAESDGATPDPEGELLDAIRIAAYSRLERLGRREGRTDLVERAIRRQAESALGGALPERERLLTLITGSAPSRTATGDTLLRGALWQLGDGSDGDAERLLARARAELGPILAVLLALARRAYRARDAKALEAICVDAGAAGGPAAYLSALRTLLAWLRHQAGEQDASLRDVTEALRLDGTNLSARALDLNLAAERSAVAYAEALERAAVASTESDAQRLWLTAAGAWAFLAGRADDARAAHRRACDAGYSEDTSPALLGLFAAVSLPPERARSALDGITSLATAGPSEWVESLRSHWLEGASERSKAAAAAHRLEREPSGQWLGRAHAAFVAALDEEATSESSALIDLAEVTDSSGTRGVLKSLAALRRRARGDTAGALRVLTDGAATPSNAFQAALLVSLAQRQRDWLTASEALRTEGERTDAPSLRFTLTTAAGFLAWRGGDRNRAIQLFESAQDQDARKAGALVDWARRAHEPDSVALRRANLDAQAGERPDDPHVALERFAMELAPDGDEPEAAMALDRIDTEGQGEAHLAAELARALWAGCGDNARADASLRLATLGDETRGAIAASTFYSELRAGRSEAARTAVQEWSDLDETDPALVERWAMSRAARDHLDEEHTLLALCNVLPAPTNTGVACLAANVSFLRGQNVAPWVFGPGPAADLTNLEHSPPGSAPERRANALGRVVGTAALVSPGASGPALVLVGLNQWASGDTERAEATFREAVAQDPECRTAWDALRDTTRVNGNLDLCCTATATLASLCNTRESAARFYEEAATLCLDELGQETRGHGYLELAVEKDIGRFSAFDRLFRREREANRTTKLLSLIEARLERTDDPDEIVKLYWERARAHRHDGNIDAAMEALGNVRILEPEHAPAMVLTAEILIKDERYEEAAEVLTTLALTESAPQKQRQLSGITAADLFEKKLGDPARALRVVVKMRDFGLQSLPLQERIARAASRVGDWPLALSALETLMLEREDPTAQVEAARLALAIHRDERKDPVGAGNAVACVLGHLPGDAEALDLVLADHFAEPESRAFVERGIEATTDALREDPLDKDRLGRLCRLARYLDRRALIQTTLGCLVVLGQGDAEAARELDQIALGSTRVPQAVLGTEQLELIAGLVTMDPIARLLARIAPELTESLGPNLETLEVSRRDRVKPSAGDPVRSELAAWARAFGLGELEMYVGGIHSSGITAVATEAPAIVAGVRVESPLPPPTIADTVQELWALKHGWTVLRHRSPEDIVAIVRACQVLAGGPQEEGPLGTVSQSAVQVDIERRLGPALSRRLRKELPTLTAALPESDAEILAWVELATLNLDRAAALATGDVSWVLRRTDRSATKGAPPLPEDEARVRTLCGFVLSPQFHALRSALGVAPA